MDRRRFAILSGLGATLALAGVQPAAAAKAPTTWDDLVRVRSKKLKYVYLLPGADFRAYKRVMLDPIQIAFAKNWKREYNNTVMGLDGRVDDGDIKRVVERGGKGAMDIFTEAYNQGGFPVVTDGAEDVLRISAAVINLRVNAPDIRTGRSRTFSEEAGQATFVVEARDSITGAILGRAVDSRIAGDDSMATWRTTVTNRSDFRQVGKAWAKYAVEGLKELQALSPVNTAGIQVAS